jgi:outer membrane protein
MLLRKIAPLFLFLLFNYSSNLSAQDFKIGIITDFEQNETVDSVLYALVEEVNRTTGAGKNFTLSPEHVRFEVDALNQSVPYYESLSTEVDFIWLVGSVSIKGMVGDTFTVPTIGLGLTDPEIEEIPFDGFKTGVDNFTFIWESQNFDKEIALFTNLYTFDTLTILVDDGAELTFNRDIAKNKLDSLSEMLSAVLHIVPINSDIDASLAKIPAGTNAVYVTLLYGRTDQEERAIAEGLISRKLPSFSSSKRQVDKGILASYADENELDQLSRKLAIMMDEASSGAELSEMPVLLDDNKEFYLNLNTARRMGFSTPFDILFTANLIEEDRELPTYSLDHIVQRSLEVNMDIQISYKDIELSEQDIINAKSFNRPSLDFGVTGNQINSERAFALLNSPEQSVTADLTFSQVLYSEETIASVKIFEYLKKAQEYQTEAEVLNVIFDTYNAYFSVLSAKTSLLIRQENLNNSSTNLDLARIRVSLGSTGNADIYRWESEVALAKQSVIDGQTFLASTKFRLNTLLSNSLEDEFDIQDVLFGDEIFDKFRDRAIAELIKSPSEFKEATEFLISEAKAINPNKKGLLENIKAVERERLMNDRLLYTPQFALQAQSSQFLYRGGDGSEPIPGTDQVDNNWSVGLSLTYPILQGKRRKANQQKSMIQLEQLDYSKRLLDQNLELTVKTNALELLNSSTNIGYSKTSSENAALNFDLVQESYRLGQVSITQLIDSQEFALESKLNYAVSIYDFMIAQLQLEYAIGAFTMFQTEAQRVDFQNRFLDFVNNN